MKKKIFIFLIIVISFFFVIGCDKEADEGYNDNEYTDENEKTDDIGWTEEDWERYYDIIDNSEN